MLIMGTTEQKKAGLNCFKQFRPAFVAVPPEGFEPPTFGTGNQRSIP